MEHVKLQAHASSTDQELTAKLHCMAEPPSAGLLVFHVEPEIATPLIYISSFQWSFISSLVQEMCVSSVRDLILFDQLTEKLMNQCSTS